MHIILITTITALAVAGLAAVAGIRYWLRPAGRFQARRYGVVAGVLCLLLAAFAIANAATGAWLWSLWSLALLAMLALVAYRTLGRNRERGTPPQKI